MGLFEAVPVFGGRHAAKKSLGGAAAYEAGDYAAAGVAVQHGYLLGDAYGVGDGDDVAEDCDFDVLGDLGDDGGIEVGGGLHAPVSAVVLVGHDPVEADFICPGVLFVVLVVEYMGLVRVEVGIGESEAAILIGFDVFVADGAVWLLGEPVDFGMFLGPG